MGISSIDEFEESFAASVAEHFGLDQDTVRSILLAYRADLLTLIAISSEAPGTTVIPEGSHAVTETEAGILIHFPTKK